MDISLWIVGIVLVGVAWVFNLITKGKIASGVKDIDSIKSTQSLATTFTSFGLGWLVGQVINYFLK